MAKKPKQSKKTEVPSVSIQRTRIALLGYPFRFSYLEHQLRIRCTATTEERRKRVYEQRINTSKKHQFDYVVCLLEIGAFIQQQRRRLTKGRNISWERLDRIAEVRDFFTLHNERFDMLYFDMAKLPDNIAQLIHDCLKDLEEQIAVTIMSFEVVDLIRKLRKQRRSTSR